MKIKHNVELPKQTQRNELRDMVLEFLESDNVNMKFECEDKNEAILTYQQLNYHRKVHDLPIVVMKRWNDIYVLRKENHDEV